MEMDSECFLASKACANESVVAGRNDPCIGEAMVPRKKEKRYTDIESTWKKY